MIHNEDCLETMARMEPGSVDLVVTSPPYDDLRDYKGYSFEFEKVAAGLWRVLKEGGTLAWVVGDRTRDGSRSGTSHRQIVHFLDTGWAYPDHLIYEKASLSYPSTRAYYQITESIPILSKGRQATFNPIEDRVNISAGDTGRGNLTIRQTDGSQMKRVSAGERRPVKRVGRRFNIWRYSNAYMMGTTDKYAYEHPATMPELLARDLILSYSDHGDTVYDPFLGSGTTAKMAISTGRRWSGSEISDDYCALARRRVNGVVEDPSWRSVQAVLG